MSNELKGLGVALITPFDKEGKVDYSALSRIISNCIKGGVKNLIVLGTTGETPTLTKEEKQEILTFVANEVEDDIVLIAGFGGNNTDQVIEEILAADLKKYKYILSVSPYYNKPTQEGIYQHYKKIAKESPLPIIIYNVPGRTSSNISSETTLKLARELDKIVGIKDASGDISQCIKIARNKPKDFVLLSGDDNLVVAQMAIGVEGCISVIANLIPKEFNDMINYASQGNFGKACEIQQKYDTLIDLIFEEGNPTGIKCALNLSNYCTDYCRLPLIPASSSLREKIKKELIQV